MHDLILCRAGRRRGDGAVVVVDLKLAGRAIGAVRRGDVYAHIARRLRIKRDGIGRAVFHRLIRGGVDDRPALSILRDLDREVLRHALTGADRPHLTSCRIEVDAVKRLALTQIGRDHSLLRADRLPAVVCVFRLTHTVVELADIPAVAALGAVGVDICVQRDVRVFFLAALVDIARRKLIQRAVARCQRHGQLAAAERRQRQSDLIRAQLELLSAALQRSVSILPNGKQLHISISGGIAWYPTDGHDLLTLKKYADFAMYQVKHSHKGRMCDFDIGSYHQEAYAAQTQQDFERLLQEELVSYHFQPIYSARSGRVAAYEALMRVDLPTLHSPAQVMQLAHETGRLYEIERITVFHSSEIFQRMQAQGLLQSDALLFINSIANVSLTVEDVEEYAQRYPELLKRLVVEITEQEDLDRACLERKRNVPGFSGSFALDDYGSGYSNELNLLELSPRYIKIDISIVRGTDTDRDKQQIVSNIVAYAHARSMQLIAEGFETEAQLRTVIGLGVDLLQGYYLSRPAAVPAPIAPAAQAVIDQLEHQRFNALGL
mgnify:CR=1 FL=1